MNYSSAQSPADNSAHIIFIAPTFGTFNGTESSLTHHNLFIDGQYVGKYKIRRFFKYGMETGKHIISFGNHKTVKEDDFHLEYIFKRGKNYYILLNYQDQTAYVITKDAADMILKVIDKECELTQ